MLLRAVSCDLGRFANAKNLLSQHAHFLLDPDEAKAIVSQMAERHVCVRAAL
jgi:hypothetical protein